MGIKLKNFLANIESKDFFFVKICEAGELLYYGYNNEVPYYLKADTYVNKVYVDFDSQVLAIAVTTL